MAEAGCRAPSLELVPRPGRRIAHQVLAGEAVLLHLGRFRIAGLNATGTYAWGLVDGRRTIGEIAALVAERFLVDRARAEADVARFFEDLASRDLVELALRQGE